MSTDNRKNKLPAELEYALKRATGRTLSAMTSLRRAVRAHVHTERSQGTELDTIQLELKGIITRALEGLPADLVPEGNHTTLTHQIIQWSGDFYTERS